MTVARMAADYGPPLLLSEPVRGQYLPRELWALPGYDQMRLWHELGDQQPHIPLDHLLGIRLEEVGFDRCSFSMPASPWFASATGFILGGMLATLADAALGIAVYVVLPGMTGIATAELSMNFVRAATPQGGTLRAHGGLIHSGRNVALSDVVVEDDGGNLLAHGTSRLVVMRPGSEAGDAPAEAIPWEPVRRYPTADPFQREPVVGETVPQETWDRLGGLDVYRAWFEGELPAAPMYHLTGILATEAEEGRIVFTMPSSEWFATGARTVQGGVLALLADCALNGAVQTTVGPRTALAPLDLSVNYLRPVFPDGRELTATGRVVHRGKRLAVAQAEVLNADGKAVLIAKGTCMILEDRPWSVLSHPVADEAHPTEE